MALRVAYILGSFPCLTETFILREILALREMGVRVALFALRRGGLELAPAITRHWSTEVRFAYPLSGLRAALGSPRKAVRFLSQIRQVRDPRSRERHLRHALSGWGWVSVLQRQRVQAVHAHFASLPTWAGWAAADLSGLPFSFAAHAWDLEFEVDLLPAKLEAACWVTTCSAFNLSRLQEHYPAAEAKARLLYHGLESEWFRPLVRLPLEVVLPEAAQVSSQAPVLLAVGRLVAKKGFHLLLQAAEYLTRAGVVFRLVLVGDGPLRALLESWAARPLLRDRVWLVGACSPDIVRRFYAAADLLVQPSLVTPTGDRDGLPNVILEAMACGLPVVASRVAGIPEAVEEGVTGYLVPPGDVVALASGLQRALRERARWPAMGRSARLRAKELFSLERNVGVLKEWLSEAVKSTIPGGEPALPWIPKSGKSAPLDRSGRPS